MANRANSLSHTKWRAAYHIVSVSKYRRKITCNRYRDSLGDIPPKPAPASFMGYLKGKSALMMCALHANLKHEFGNRRFWSEGHCVSTVGPSEAAIRKRIQEQEAHDIAPGKLSVKEHGDPFKKLR